VDRQEPARILPLSAHLPVKSVASLTRASSQHNGPTYGIIDTRFTDKHANQMPVTIQIRNVPYGLHRELKARAALEGMSISDYLLRELRQLLDRPTLEEILKRLANRQRVRAHPAPASVIRAERNSY
jgi:plasmid stability protein